MIASPVFLPLWVRILVLAALVAASAAAGARSGGLHVALGAGGLALMVVGLVAFPRR